MKKWLVIFFCIYVLFFLNLVSADISGTVRDSSSNSLQGVVVEAWQSNTLVSSTNTNSLGQYTLTGLTNGQAYTIRAYNFTNTTNRVGDDYGADPEYCWTEDFIGYIPKESSVTNPATSINFNLNSIPVKNVDYLVSQEFIQFYGLSSTSNDLLLKRGDVVITRDTQGNIDGVGVNCWSNHRGWYVLFVFGDDSFTTGIDEGATDGELIDFYINGNPAINTSGSATWSKDGGGGNTELSTTGAVASCQLTNASWNQTSATERNAVTLSIESTGCYNKEIQFIIKEGGVVARGDASVQPVNAIIDYTGTVSKTWITEYVNDDGGGDTNPPEYYFIAQLVEDPNINIDSSSLNNYLLVNPDTTTPIVSNDNLSYFGENVIIKWKTNEPTTTQIDYGKTTSYGSSFTNNTLTTNHVAVLNNLDLNQNYYYRIVTADESGNVDNSVQGTFFINDPVTIVLQQGAYNYYYGVDDTYLYSQGDRDVGYLTEVRLGQRLDGGGDLSQPLFRFDTLPIPVNANIISAKLELYYFTNSDNSSTLQTVSGDLYRILRPWGSEGNDSNVNLGEVTWNYSFYDTVTWGIPGAEQIGVDREGGSQSTNVFMATTPFGWKTWNLNTPMVQDWVSTPSTNNGVVIKAAAMPLATRYWFRSSEYAYLNESPRLIITYTRSGEAHTPDVNSDGNINVIDLAIVIFNQGRDPADSRYSHLDLNYDNKIDFSDAREVMKNIN